MSARTARNVASPPNESLEEPPPYTPQPDTFQGEETLEYGPSRPFQQAPAPPPQPSFQPGLFATPQPPAPPQHPQSSLQTTQTTTTFLSPQPTGFPQRPSGRGGSLWRQLSDQIDQIATQIERHATGVNGRSNFYPPANGSTWSSYPGPAAASRSAYALPSAPPPTQYSTQQSPHHSLSSTSSLSVGTSDFAQSFYAAGAGEEPSPASGSNRGPQPQSERGPTTTPVPGRPLLHEGKLLVYPKGHTCEKCHNTGYKHYDPLRPCKKCWSKYGKPFSGPIAYSYSSSSPISNTQNTNLQKPLPNHVPPTSAPPPLPPRSTPSMSSQGGYYAPGQGTTFLQPPPGAFYYQPGDPRLGGNLCWSCHGKGFVNVLISNIQCPICDGCGRTF